MLHPKTPLWPRIYRAANWILIAYFGGMAIIHVVLAVLYWLGVWDTGVGYLLDFDLPAWVIAVLDGSAAYLLWMGYRMGMSKAWLGLALTVFASAIMIGRALWFVIIPVLVSIAVVGASRRVAESQRPEGIART